MLFIVTAISLLVHIYSTEYLHDDCRFTHYYAFLSLFSASMLFYVTSSNTIQMLTGWELVGVCSFALIGHWWEEKNNTDAALKAFLTNRVGDIGLIIGVIITFFAAGATSFNMLHINQYALSPAANQTLLLVGGAVPVRRRHVEVGPVPAAHLAARRHGRPDAGLGAHPRRHHGRRRRLPGRPPLLGVLRRPQHRRQLDQLRRRRSAASPSSVGALLAFVQTDIKKVLAYSTISQLGYMVMALGVGAWTGAIFHLFTHAFFKACLFLGAGSVSHAAHHTFDMREDGRPQEVHADRPSGPSSSARSRSWASSRWPASGRRTRSWPARSTARAATPTCSC